jgi:low affinity Fe/Cu permease
MAGRPANRTRRSSIGHSTAKPEAPPSVVDRFRAVSDGVTDALGTPWALVVALVLIIVWGMTRPIFHFGDTSQLAINTATTIVTFLMVFVIQTSQNRQAKATQFKLDELIRSIPGARNRMIEAERGSTEELKRQEEEFQRTAERGGILGVPPVEVAARRRSKRGSSR